MRYCKISGEGSFNPDDPRAIFENLPLGRGAAFGDDYSFINDNDPNMSNVSSLSGVEGTGYTSVTPTNTLRNSQAGGAPSFWDVLFSPSPAKIGDDSPVTKVIQAYTGSHTIADCLTLEANYDKWIKELSDQFNGLMSAWKNVDPVVEKAWGLDYNGLATRWSAAKQAVTAATSAVLPNSVSGAEDVYQGLIRALRQGGEGAVLQPGDFEDLKNRLQAYASSVATTLKFSPAVQPEAGPTDPGYRGIGGFNAFKAPAIPWRDVLLAAGIVAGALVAIEVVPVLIMAKAVSAPVRHEGTRFYKRRVRDIHGL